MRERISGVYAIHSIDGHIYIGSSVDIMKRWSEHKCRLRNDRHDNKILTDVAAKNGVESLQFRLLLRCSRDNLRFYEQLVIDVLKPTLNVLPTSTHYLSEHWKRPEFRARNIERTKKQNAEFWSNQENIEKARERAAVMNTDSVKEKAIEGRRKSMAERGQAYQNMIKASSSTFKRLHADPGFAKKHAERKRKELLERCKDKEFCARRDKAAAEANKKPIKCITTGDVFPSKREAAESLGISVSLISKQLRGLPTRTNLQWKFVNG